MLNQFRVLETLSRFNLDKGLSKNGICGGLCNYFINFVIDKLDKKPQEIAQMMNTNLAEIIEARLSMEDLSQIAQALHTYQNGYLSRHIDYQASTFIRECYLQTELTRLNRLLNHHKSAASHCIETTGLIKKEKIGFCYTRPELKIIIEEFILANEGNPLFIHSGIHGIFGCYLDGVYLHYDPSSDKGCVILTGSKDELTLQILQEIIDSFYQHCPVETDFYAIGFHVYKKMESAREICDEDHKAHKIITKWLSDYNQSDFNLDEKKDAFGITPLWISLYTGNNPYNITLLEYSKDINLTLKPCHAINLGLSPLLLACAHVSADIELINKLLTSGANVTQTTDNDLSPLVFAVKNNDFEVALTLADRIRPDLLPRQLTLALFWAITYSTKDMVEWVLNRIESAKVINGTNQDKDAPLTIAVLRNDLSILALLLKLHADLEYEDACGNTALSIAAQFGHDIMIEELLKEGANIEHRNQYGQTPLMMAVIHNRTAAAKCLLKHNANLHTVDKHQISVYWYAKINQNNELFCELISRGEAIKALPDDYTRLQLKLIEIIFSIEEKLGKPFPFNMESPVCFAVKRDINLLKECLQSGGSVSYRNEFDEGPLYHAVIAGNIAAVDILIAHDINHIHTDGYEISYQYVRGMSPFSLAALHGYTDIVDLFIRVGFSVNKSDRTGTPLCAAVLGGHYDLCQKLINAKADVNTMDVDIPASPLCLAAFNRLGNITQLLIDNNADINIIKNSKNNLFFKPLFAAVASDKNTNLLKKL